jgi:Ser-tRNA(Ala) deacylase AlaX
MYKAQNLLGRSTKKLYYEDSFLKSCTAEVVKVMENKIELNQTVAYPEGGGQEGDIGFIQTSAGVVIRFTDTQKMYGRKLYLDDFPSINVDTIIHHIVCDEDIHLLTSVPEGETVVVTIDIQRRENLSISHTSSHLVFVGVGEVMPEAIKNVKGCHIDESSARFDFYVHRRFTQEDVAKIQDLANSMVKEDLVINTYQHPEEPEAWYWEAKGHVIPCGGTHLRRTSSIGEILVRRKNIGKNVERIIINFPNAVVDESLYHS